MHLNLEIDKPISDNNKEKMSFKRALILHIAKHIPK
jgi:hypothetical protein